MTESKEFLSYLLKGDRVACMDVVNQLLDATVSVEDIYEYVIRKSLYEVGDLWEAGKITVASEHLASSIAESVLNELYLKVLTDVKIEKKAVIGCVPNEYHQIRVKMVSDMFEKNGWTVFFLGANVPVSDFIDFARGINADVVGISMSLYSHLPDLLKMLNALQSEFPETPILVGGQAFTRGSRDPLLKYSQVTYMADIYALEKFLNKKVKQ